MLVHLAHSSNCQQQLNVSELTACSGERDAAVLNAALHGARLCCQQWGLLGVGNMEHLAVAHWALLGANHSCY